MGSKRRLYAETYSLILSASSAAWLPQHCRALGPSFASLAFVKFAFIENSIFEFLSQYYISIIYYIILVYNIYVVYFIIFDRRREGSLVLFLSNENNRPHTLIMFAGG